MAIAQAEVNRQHQEAPTRGIQIFWSTSCGSIKPSAALQQQIKEQVSQLEAQARVRELLRLLVTTHTNSIVEANGAEIGIRLHLGSHDSMEGVTLDLVFNGDHGLTREIATTLPLSELRSRLLRLLRVYTVEGCAKDTFATWSRGLSDQDLRSRLGLPEQAVFAG